MTKEQNVINFYVLCNKLKNVIRTGWKDCKVSADRLESVAEHIYGTQMLAIAMFSEFKAKIDISKVIMMLALHEIEEIIIGDLTPFQMNEQEKTALGHEGVKKVLSCLDLKDDLEKLIIEFDERKTPEAKFALFCDKLECDLQCKLYDEGNFVDKSTLMKVAKREEVKTQLQEGKSWSELWMEFTDSCYHYDNDFKKVATEAKNNKISQ